MPVHFNSPVVRSRPSSTPSVADFFHFFTPFSLGPLSNYVFNLADVGIVAGVALLLYESVFVKEAPAEAASSP